MRKFLLLTALFLSITAIQAQSPGKISYQTIIRSSAGAPLVSTDVTMRFTIASSIDGQGLAWQEERTLTTNAQGLINLYLGEISPLNSVNWSVGPKFLSVEVDFSDGNGYLLVGSQELVSVPFSLYSNESGIAESATNAQNAVNAQTAQTAVNADNATNAQNAVNAQTAQTAVSADNATNAQNAVNAQTAQTAVNADNATNAQNAVNAQSAQTAVNANNATNAQNAVNAQSAQTAVNADNATYAQTAGISQTSVNSNFSLSAGNGFKSVSAVGDTLFLVNGSFLIIPGLSVANYSALTDSVTTASCGAPTVHNGAVSYGQVSDNEGRTYRTTIIGATEWMAENLAVTKYNNGDVILAAPSAATWELQTTGAWSWYDNNFEFDCPYGKLYNWFTVNDPRGICPTGWNVPTDEEMTNLITFLGSTIAGTKLKAQGTDYWNAPNSGATNETGFSALPGGYRLNTGEFNYNSGYGFIWTSTDFGGGFAYVNQTAYNQGSTERLFFNKKLGCSVRCKRNL